MLMSSILLLTNSGKSIVLANEINKVKDEIACDVKKMMKSSDDDVSDESYIVLEEAMDSYEDEFEEYIDITALNVELKELVTLPNFNINYVAPTFADVMYDYQINLEASLTSVELLKYDNLRMQNYNFDKYVALNATKYVNLSIPPKYDHSLEIDYYALDIAGLVLILTRAGLSQAAISAFTGSVGTLSTAVSASWIPVVGQSVAIGIAIGALIAIAALIVIYWDEICYHVNAFRGWLLEEFEAFEDLIDSYFSDAIEQGEESTIAERQMVGNITLVWRDAHMTKDVVKSIATSLRRNSTDVVLMKNISFPRTNEMNWWIADGYVTTDFVIRNKLYEAPYYFSTYTWYNNTAKRILHDGAPNYSSYGGYGYDNLVYHRFTDMQSAIYGWNHYHMGKYDPIKQKAVTYSNNQMIHSVHVFFGLTYIRKSDNTGFDSYPVNP